MSTSCAPKGYSTVSPLAIVNGASGTIAFLGGTPVWLCSGRKKLLYFVMFSHDTSNKILTAKVGKKASWSVWG